MFEKYSYKFLLIVLLTNSQLAFPQESPQLRSRDVLIKESIAKLDSNDLHVAQQAAYDLGMYRAPEAVPAMLRVLRSSRLLSTTEHIMAKDKDSMSLWVLTDARAAIINSLGLIGDQRAVPVLKKYLKKPLSNREVFTGNVALALFRITGKSYEYKTFEGVQQLYEPSPFDEEEFRKHSRPDLKPTEGLTVALEIEWHDPRGYWLGNRPLAINLTIANQSKRAIEIDASADNFLFSSLSGERTNTPANLLTSSKPGAEITLIKPGQKLELGWVVKVLNESPLSRGWAGDVYIKCVYTNPRKKNGGAMWRGELLISNSVEGFYFPAIEQLVGPERGSRVL